MKKTYKMSDDTIAVIREIVQLALLTNSSLIDHMRAIQLEVDEESGKLVPTEEYIESYNKMIKQLLEEAEKKQLEIFKQENAVKFVN